MARQNLDGMGLMMAEEAEKEQEEVDPVGEPKGAWLKQFIILAVLVLVGQSIVAYVLVTQQIIPWYFGEDDASEQVQKEAKTIKREPVPVDMPILFDIDEMTVNPQDYHTIRYLNIKMSLELDSQETFDFLKMDPVASAKVRETIREALNMTNFRELDDAVERGPLREKLAAKINASGLLNDGMVTNVYFQRFIAQ